MLSGLYYMVPLFLFQEKGHPRDDSTTRYGTSDISSIVDRQFAPHVPDVRPDNPVLFLEYDQELTRELTDRGKELDLDLVHGLVRAAEWGRPRDPLLVEWFHGAYHAEPFDPLLPNDVEARFWFVMRAPQAVAYSLFRVSNERWTPYSRGKRGTKGFLEFYDDEFLQSIFRFYDRYMELSEHHRTAILRYENLVAGPEPLLDLVSRCVGQEPKLSPTYVWNTARFPGIVAQGRKRTFYRRGRPSDWLMRLPRRDLRKMEEIERRFDFGAIGYPMTADLLRTQDMRTRIWTYARRALPKRTVVP